MKLVIKEMYYPQYAETMKQIYRSVGWNNHTIEIINQVFTSSTHVAIAFKGEQLIGFGRALSDGVFNGAIYDVIVQMDEQGNGVARTIIDSLLTQLESVSCVHLISTIGNEEFYRKCGFQTLKTGMARYLNENLSKIYLGE